MLELVVVDSENPAKVCLNQSLPQPNLLCSSQVIDVQEYAQWFVLFENDLMFISVMKLKS